MTVIRVGLIGCGRISGKHIDGIAANSDCLRLVAVSDIVEQRMKNALSRYADKTGLEAEGHADYKQLLAREDIDCIAIATESGLHAGMSLESLAAGKHVLVEKPMALSTGDCKRMLAAAEAKNLKLAVCHQNRFNPPVQKLRNAVEEGRMGKLINGTACVRWNRNDNYYRQAPWRGTWAMDGGTLMNQCLHNIDLLQWMLGGQAVSVYAQTGTFLRPIEAEDFGAILVRFDNGAIGLVEGSACVYPSNHEETLSIFGESGTIGLGGLAVNKIVTWKVLGSDDEGLGVNSSDPDTVYGDGHIPLYRDFFDAVSQDRQPYIDGVEGYKAVEIILAAYKSQKEQAPVSLPVDFSSKEMEGLDLKVR